MVPMQLCLEGYDGEHCEHSKGDDLLNDFQLHYVKRTAVILEPQPIGRHLQTVFEECHSPTESYHTDKRKRRKPVELLFHLQMSVPRHCHEHI